MSKYFDHLLCLSLNIFLVTVIVGLRAIVLLMDSWYAFNSVLRKSVSTQDQKVTLKMHDLKMTDKENYGSGKCKSGK